MPEISRFRGIKITINFNDHNPAHFHVEYAGKNMVVEIENPAIAESTLPTKIRRRVIEWAIIHQDELREAWASRRHEHPGRIPPLE